MRFGWLGLGFAAIACAGGADDGARTDTSTTTSSTPPPVTTPDAGAATTTDTPPPAGTSTSRGEVPVEPTDPPDASAPVDAAPPPPPFTVTNESITVGGKERSYILVVPTSYAASKTYPLVLALHGDGGDGERMRAGLHFEDASGQDAIVVYPNGAGKTWDLYSPADRDPDVAYLLALVEALRARFHVGGAFGLGMSSGAFMVNQMACRAPALFRGIVSHSGGAPDEPNDTHGSWGGDFVRCNGQSTGVAVLVIHGMDDQTVAFPSGGHDANYWATVNGCGAGYSAVSPDPCRSRSGCPADKPVVFCPIEGLGHALWGQAASASWTFISSL